MWIRVIKYIVPTIYTPKQISCNKGLLSGKQKGRQIRAALCVVAINHRPSSRGAVTGGNLSVPALLFAHLQVTLEGAKCKKQKSCYEYGASRAYHARFYFSHLPEGNYRHGNYSKENGEYELELESPSQSFTCNHPAFFSECHLHRLPVDPRFSENVELVPFLECLVVINKNGVRPEGWVEILVRIVGVIVHNPFGSVLDCTEELLCEVPQKILSFSLKRVHLALRLRVEINATEVFHETSFSGLG